MAIDESVNPTGYPFWWNYILATFSTFKFNQCTAWGLWGLLFYNDGGEMIEACLQVGLVGAKASYIADDGIQNM